ncbi:uncharacterized protein LOC133201420 [Saccostrea echinata]|uniref:uncharacterized protein LOC133201420 n=1 Tax=Saccostrea echinata TaxID=191078 RepID=UPI002A81CB72|nr:uncharacterized protein LOC133201420 [Saccostrea echinata]
MTQNYDAQAPWGFHTGNAIQPQGQTTPQPFLQQQQQQHQQQLINEQKERLTPHKNEAFMTSKQPHSNQQMTYTSKPSIFYPQNHDVQAPWGIYPFIQQQGHTTPQPTQQQHQQQHLMTGQNERLTPYRNDAYMPSQLPTFNQYMAAPSSKGWDSLGYKTRQHLPPLIKLDGSMENMSASPASPMRNMSASHAGSMGNMSASPAGPMGSMSASPAGPMRNMSSSPAGSMGNMSPSPSGTMGNMSASPAGPMGNMSPSPAGPMGNMSDFPAGTIGNMSASPAGPMGNMSASPAGPMGNMSASPSSPLRNMSTSPAHPKGNMSASHAGPIGNLSASPNDSIGNDHRILHDLNQRPCSQPLDPIDDRFSQFPMIIAEKRNYDDSIGEIGNCILAKRPKTDAYTDPLGTSVNYKDLSGDEDRRLDSGNNKDPLSDLTKDQRIVLYTLFLCQDYIGKICIDGDDCIGDIDVGEIIKELRNKGLVEPRIPGDRVYISFEKRPHIMKSYRENCLLSEIDKDFFIQVASNGSIGKYAEEYCRHVDGSRKSEDIGPITMMRLIVEGRGNELPSSVKDEVPAFLIDDEKELGKFVKFWCKARNADPVTLSDQIPDEKIKKFYSAFTILSGLKNELMEMHFSKKKWSILISILMSESYSVCVNMPWEEKRKEIQQTFISLQDVKEERADEDLVLLKELEHCDILLTVDRENKYLYFVSEEVRHQVMGYFVLNCLESKEDYENFLNLSSVDSLFEYARPLRYKRNVTERCMYLPKGTEELLIRRLGIDAILHASIGNNDIAEEISSKHLFNLSLPSSKMGILCTILLSNGYKLCLKEQWKDSIKETRQTFKALQSNEAVEDELLIKELVNNDNMLMKDDVLNNVHFAKDDVRHQVMSYFVRTCLDTDEDYINYIDLSSVDSLLEYVRTWRFGNVEEERCLHLPERMEDKYIKKLDVHILCHVNMKEFRCGITELANNFYEETDVHVLGPHKNPENSPTEKQPSCLGEFSCNKAAKLLRKIFHRPTRFVEGLVEKLLSPNKKYYSKL